MNEKTSTLSEKLFVTFLSFALLYILMRFFLPISIPFVLAYLISRIVRPISKAIRARSKKLDKPVTVIVLIFIFAVLYLAFRSMIVAAADQLSRLIEAILADISSPDGFFARLTSFFRDVGAHVPFLKEDAQSADDTASLVVSLTRDSLSYLSSRAAGAAGEVLRSLPSFFISFFVMLTATFYFSLDRGSFADFIRSYIPVRYRQKVRRCCDAAGSAAFAYLKTYLLMMLVVFTLLYLGFTIIGVEYALVIALITAIVDLLPILGVGTVLVPWAGIALVLGDVRLAISLLVLLAVETIVRELLEPKVIGGYIGMHPILALVAVYVGLNLFGVTGLIASPIILSMILSVIGAGGVEDEKTAPEGPERMNIGNSVMLSEQSDRSLRRPDGKRRTSDRTRRH